MPGQHWSDMDEKLLIHLQALWGNDWKRISDCSWHMWEKNNKAIQQKFRRLERQSEDKAPKKKKAKKEKSAKKQIEELKKLPDISCYPTAKGFGGEMVIDKCTIGIGQEPVEYAYTL